MEGFSIRAVTDLILSRSRHHGHPFFRLRCCVLEACLLVRCVLRCLGEGAARA